MTYRDQIRAAAIDVRPESDVITSFFLSRADGKAPASHQPGQFLPIRLEVPGEDMPAMRTYTTSDASNGNTYRLSIKREGGTALISNFLHGQVKTASVLKRWHRAENSRSIDQAIARLCSSPPASASPGKA